MDENKTAWVDICEITKHYLPISKRKARRFALSYLPIKRVGNRILVERSKLEELLADPDRERFPIYV